MMCIDKEHAGKDSIHCRLNSSQQNESALENCETVNILIFHQNVSYKPSEPSLDFTVLCS